MTRFEYRICTHSEHLPIWEDDPALEALLNKHGLNRWQLIMQTQKGRWVFVRIMDESESMEGDDDK